MSDDVEFWRQQMDKFKDRTAKSTNLQEKKGYAVCEMICRVEIECAEAEAKRKERRWL